MYDLIIIGGGPAGIAAGVYASRKRLSTLFITKDWGGQSIVSPDIQNWIGSPTISGNKLALDLKTHLETYASDFVTIIADQLVTALAAETPADHTPDVHTRYTVTTSSQATYQARAILIASGSTRRRLEIPGATEYEHKGLTYCASCDGPLFAGQDVAVIGGGNAGFETAAQLLAYAASVTLFHRGPAYKADPITIEKVLAHPNMRGILNTEPTRISGQKFVQNLTYRDTQSGAETELAVTGIFAEIGMIPNTDFAKDLVARDDYSRISIDPWTQQTSAPFIWAAGDCTNVKYHQNNISAGDGVRALEDIYVNLRAK